MSIREFSVITLVCLIWGLHFVVMKLVVGHIAEPLFYAALRMTIVAVILLPKLKWHKGLMRYVLAAGLGYGAFNYAFMFPAMGMTTASAAAIGIELFVPFSIILSMLIFKDKIGWFKFLGIALAFIGVAIIGGSGPDESAGPLFLLGFFMIVCAAMSEAVGANMVKMAKSVAPLELLAWFSVVGVCVLWPMSLALETDHAQAFSPDNRTAFLAALAYSAILVSLVAHGSYYWLLQRLPIYVVSTTGLMTTVIAVTGSVLILGETLSTELVLGGLITLAGVGIILLRNGKSSNNITT